MLPSELIYDGFSLVRSHSIRLQFTNRQLVNLVLCKWVFSNRTRSNSTDSEEVSLRSSVPMVPLAILEFFSMLPSCCRIRVDKKTRQVFCLLGVKCTLCIEFTSRNMPPVRQLAAGTASSRSPFSRLLSLSQTTQLLRQLCRFGLQPLQLGRQLGRFPCHPGGLDRLGDSVSKVGYDGDDAQSSAPIVTVGDGHAC